MRSKTRTKTDACFSPPITNSTGSGTGSTGASSKRIRWNCGTIWNAAKQEQLIKEATVDGVQVGNDQYELQHGIRGERTHAGTWEGLNGRRAEAGGWFSYDMGVLRGQQNALHVTFCKLHHGGSMEIWADGRLLFTEPFEGRPQRAFYEKNFDLLSRADFGPGHREHQVCPPRRHERNLRRAPDAKGLIFTGLQV